MPYCPCNSVVSSPLQESDSDQSFRQPILLQSSVLLCDVSAVNSGKPYCSCNPGLDLDFMQQQLHLASTALLPESLLLIGTCLYSHNALRHNSAIVPVILQQMIEAVTKQLCWICKSLQIFISLVKTCSRSDVLTE